MSKELLKNLSTSQKRQRTAAIHLPWKRESTEAGTSTGKIERPNEVLIPSIDVEGSKAGKQSGNMK
jgi:hypothetical protein